MARAMSLSGAGLSPGIHALRQRAEPPPSLPICGVGPRPDVGRWRGAVTGIVRLAVIGYNQGDVTRRLGAKANCSCKATVGACCIPLAWAYAWLLCSNIS